MGERVPQHVQNLVIRDYCVRNNLQYLLSATEYAMPKCHLILEQIIEELPELFGIIVYSLFQLPEDANLRKGIYQKVMESNKNIYFAVESIKANTILDFEQVETLWKIRQTLPHCISIY
jgi:sporadic carbohydrate cluster protein (TIGR04323 family)